MAKGRSSTGGSRTRGAAKKVAAAEDALLSGASEHAAPTPPTPGAGIDLEEVKGQVEADATLREALAGPAGRVHHAYLFHGPSGVGKFTAARAFARKLLDPGDDSPASRQARAGTHPDLHIVRKELAAVSRDDRVRRGKQITLAVAVLRQFLIEPAALAATIGGAGSRASKVFIVDEAEHMDPSGQNAILKTLEEPPPGTVIILVTSAIDRLLPTVRSRCQSVRFGPLDEAAMATWAGSAGLGNDARERSWLIWLADGSPGAALLAAERGLPAWEATLGPLLDGAERGAYQPALGPEMARLVDEQVAATMKSQPDGSKEAANRAWARRLLAYVARRARDRMRRAGGVDGALDVLDLLEEAERAIIANVRASDAMENFSVQLARLGRPGSAAVAARA